MTRSRPWPVAADVVVTVVLSMAVAAGVFLAVVLGAGLDAAALDAAALAGVVPAALAAGLVVPVVAIVSILRRRPVVVTPADRVTLLRVVLIGGSAAYVALWAFGLASAQSWIFAGVVIPAAALDAVDGWVARRTGTSTEAGARFDMEADAALYLIVCIPLGVAIGWWVWLIGAARYLFVAGGLLRPAWRGELAYRPSRRVIAALQAVVLAALTAPVIPVPAAAAATGIACLLLLFSFGRDILTLERRAGSER